VGLTRFPEIPFTMYRVLFVILFFFSSFANAQNNNNFEISKNLDIYSSLLKELNLNYVDEIDPSSLNKTAIEAMLNALDPYTVFIPESQIEEFQLMTTGEYGGIGSLIQQKGEFIIISEPYEGFPAQKAGLIPDDKLIEINGLSMKGKTSQEVSELLKGQPGTPIHIRVEREGETEPMSKQLIREKIRIDNIPYYDILKGDIAYIRLSGFTQKAAAEMKKIFMEMKESAELKGLIIDLRGNGGGLLNEAVDITNLFIPKGEVVVTTKGKTAEQNTAHPTRMTPVDTQIPIVVLVNEASASASEIVAGALQDFDRAVVVGQRTFGKGLVQNVVPLSYNTQLKITIAKYYIPSGRCIQSVDYADKNPAINGTQIKAPVAGEFKTRRGRTVTDGGGILPDIILEPLRFSAVSSNLYTENLVFDFANQFARKHKSIGDAADFRIDDETYAEFVAFVNQKNFTFRTESEDMIENLRKIAEEENYYHAVAAHIRQLEEKLTEYKKNDIYKHRLEVDEMLKVEIASRYYYQKGKIIASLQNDPELKKAIEVITDPVVYGKLLTP